MRSTGRYGIGVFALPAYVVLAQGVLALSGVDGPTDCRYEAPTEGELLAVKAICVSSGSLGVTRAVASGNALKVSVDDSMADTLTKGGEFSDRIAAGLAEDFAGFSRNRVERVRVEFFHKDKFMLAAEGTAESVKVLRGKPHEDSTVATGCEKLASGIAKPPFSERDEAILEAVRSSSEPEDAVFRSMGKKYGISAKAAEEAARRAQEAQYSNWGSKRDEKVKEAVICFVEHRGLRLVDAPIVLGGHVTVGADSEREATDQMDPLAKDILGLPGISSTLIDLRHNGKRVGNRRYP